MDFDAPSCTHCGSEWLSYFASYFVLLAVPLALIFAGRAMRRTPQLMQFGIAVQSLGVFSLLVSAAFIVMTAITVP